MRPGRLHVSELPEGIDDPQPDRHAGVRYHPPRTRRPVIAFHLGVVAVTLEHQVGDAPNVDLGDDKRRLSKVCP